MTIIKKFQMLPFAIGGFACNVLASPNPRLLLYIFDAIMLSSVRKYLSARPSIAEKPVNCFVLAGVCIIRVVTERYY